MSDSRCAGCGRTFKTHRALIVHQVHKHAESACRAARTFEHGTYAGYLREVKAHQRPCDACRDAQKKYMREYRASDAGRAKQQIVSVATGRALQRLKEAHWEEYRRFYEEERTALEAAGQEVAA